MHNDADKSPAKDLWLWSQVVQQVLKWDEVMAAVQHDKQRLMRMHCHMDFDRLDSMGHTLLSELIKPRHCVAVVDAFVLDLVLLYNNPKQVSCWSGSRLCLLMPGLWSAQCTLA